MRSPQTPPKKWGNIGRVGQHPKFTLQFLRIVKGSHPIWVHTFMPHPPPYQKKHGLVPMLLEDQFLGNPVVMSVVGWTVCMKAVKSPYGAGRKMCLNNSVLWSISADMSYPFLDCASFHTCPLFMVARHQLKLRRKIYAKLLLHGRTMISKHSMGRTCTPTCPASGSSFSMYDQHGL